MENTEILKTRLHDYLSTKGITPDKDNLINCLNPSHPDHNPSMTVYDNNVNCNSCGWKGDIFDCAGAITGKTEFVDQLNEVKKSLGESVSPTPEKTQKQSATVPVPVSKKQAEKVFNDTNLLKYANFVLNKDLEPDHKKYRSVKIVKLWPYRDASGKIDLAVVRFEDQHKKKHVLTYYWNGKNLKMSGYPVLIYGRDRLAERPDLPVMIHEGEKCADIGTEHLKNFVHISWNGGGKKFPTADWSILKDREIYILGDDDAPGQKTAKELKSLLGNDSILIPPHPGAREIKKKGADIEEILQVITPEDFKEGVLSLKNKKIVATKKVDNQKGRSKDETKNSIHGSNQDTDLQHSKTDNVQDNDGYVGSGYPFKILGIGADNRAYFLDYENRLLSHELSSLTDKKLIELGGLQYFKTNYAGIPKKDDWLTEIDAIMHLSKKGDFNIDNIRGRGAWKTSNGKICYFDGKQTRGKPNKEWTLIRKPQVKIGLSFPQASPGDRSEIMRLSKTFSFKTPTDAVRLLSWAVLAPFAGALPWRPAFLATGPSGSGKSTIIDKIIRPISKPLAVNGASTTEAGIRQYNGNDSGGIIVDEAERRKKNDKERIENIFALMRASTTDDSPLTLKGSAGGSAMSFSMRSMFGFVAIDASVDDVADDNRIVRINFKKSDNFKEYLKNIAMIDDLLTVENCNGIRAFTWDRLPDIIKLAKRLELIIQDVTKQDSRFAAGESILLAANFIVWENLPDGLPDEDLSEYVAGFYKGQKFNEKRDETTEMIERLLDETVLIGEKRETHSFRSILIEMKKFLDEEAAIKTGEWENVPKKSGIIDYATFHLFKKSIEHFGVTVHKKTRELFIAQNHNRIMRILEIGKGYHHQIERHDGVIDKQKTAVIDKATKRGTILKGFLGYE